jgi:hypothetical protein
MIEEIDTNNDYSDKIIPDGQYTFTTLGFRKVKSSYAVALSYGDGIEGEILMFGNEMGPLLKVLGCAEGSAPGKYVLNTDIAVGVTFSAKIYTTDKGYKKMKDILPF